MVGITVNLVIYNKLTNEISIISVQCLCNTTPMRNFKCILSIDGKGLAGPLAEPGWAELIIQVRGQNEIKRAACWAKSNQKNE